jgi:hypothetical protein
MVVTRVDMAAVAAAAALVARAAMEVAAVMVVAATVGASPPGIKQLMSAL